MRTEAKSPEQLKNTLQKKFPDVLRNLANQGDLFFATGVDALDRLFASGRGIPYGQLVELTGTVSSGKTSLLFHILGAGSRVGKTIAYVDFGNSFFPDAAVASGVDLERLLLIKPKLNQKSGHLKQGIRTGELLLRDHQADIIVFDLVGIKEMLPLSLLHRLRLRTVRAKGLVLFLTQTNRPTQNLSNGIIPSSMASLRLEISRVEKTKANHLLVKVTKSRICTEGTQIEVHL